MSSPTFSVTDIKEIVAAAIAAANAPKPLTPHQESELQMAQQHREDTAKSVLAKKHQEKEFQKMCTHEHTKREGGGTHAVWIRDNDLAWSPGFIYCQKCSTRVRPDDDRMKKLDPEAWFDTSLFNKLFQDCNGGEILG